MASATDTPSCSAASRNCCVISMLQNFGPHIEQKCATLAPSAGSVSIVKRARGDRVERQD